MLKYYKNTGGMSSRYVNKLFASPEAQTPDEGMFVDRRKRQARACVRNATPLGPEWANSRTSGA